MVKIHKKSKRQTTRLRAKIEKKVKEHRRKQKRADKKNPTSKRRKDPGIPNSLPFKEAILKEAETRRQQQEEARTKQKERRKKERAGLVNKKRSLDGLVQDAQKRTADYDRKQASAKQKEAGFTGGKAVESSLKTFYKEFRKVVEAADVILEILDARDPLGSRCREMEEAILGTGTNKRLVLVLNKVDLVPRDNVEAWLKHLKNEFPVVAFKASTQTQNNNLSHSKVKIALANQDLLQSSPCLGADVLMKLLGNYCRNKDIKTVIRVGVVGLPNTGKSSIINSLKRSKTCNVGSVPGVTKQMQEVQLDKHIRLLDSPGVVMATGTSDTSTILRNCVKLESLQDPLEPVEAIMKRCNKQQMMMHYCLPEFDSVADFLSLLAKRQGKLKKGGVPDTTKAARTVLQDWNGGKITFYTHPPETKSVHVSAEVVTEMSQEFDLDSLLSDQQQVIDNLNPTSGKYMLVDSLGPAKVSLKPDAFTKSDMDVDGDGDDDDDAEEEEEEDEEKMEDSDDEVEEEDEMTGMTVSVPTSGKQSRTSEKSAKAGAASKKDKLNVGLPQLNKSRKADFKKMKKQRKRRDKVAGELSDALSTAFGSFGSEEGGNDDGNLDDDDDYNFGEHFK